MRDLKEEKKTKPKFKKPSVLEFIQPSGRRKRLINLSPLCKIIDHDQ
jgi:hypothetical protein